MICALASCELLRSSLDALPVVVLVQLRVSAGEGGERAPEPSAASATPTVSRKGMLSTMAASTATRLPALTATAASRVQIETVVEYRHGSAAGRPSWLPS